MMKLRWTGWMTAALVAAAVGCGGEGGVALGELEDELEDAFCQWLVRCDAIEQRSDCPALFGEGGLDPQLTSGVEDGTILYDAAAAAACLDAIAGSTCAGGPAGDEDVEACDRVFTGTVADGGDCFADEQCQSGACDEDETGSCDAACCAGTCEPTTPEAEVGESCAAAECVAGAYCAGGTCAARKPAGDACELDRECREGLHCAGTCEPMPKAGEPCAGDFGRCGGPGLACDASGVCREVLHEGQACDVEASLCSSIYLVCAAATSTCERFPVAGEPCPDFRCRGGAYCDFDFETDTAICVAPKADGEACESDGECTSDYCDEDTSQCAAEPICS